VGAPPHEVDLESLLGASVASGASALSLQLGVEITERALRAALSTAIRRRAPQVLPGVRSVLGSLNGTVPLAVASNGPKAIITDAVKSAGLLEAFSVVVTADDVALPKPAPDVYLLACARLDVPPSSAIALEDSPVGARAASRAGLTVVGVGTEVADHRGIDLHVDSLADGQLLQYLRQIG